jgi:hypothetical protein
VPRRCDIGSSLPWEFSLFIGGAGDFHEGLHQEVVLGEKVRGGVARIAGEKYVEEERERRIVNGLAPDVGAYQG